MTALNTRKTCSVYLVAFMAIVTTSASPAQPITENADTIQLYRNYRLFSNRLTTLLVQTIERNHSLKAARSTVNEADAVRATIGQSPPRFEIAAMDARLTSFPNPLTNQMQMDYSIEQMVMFPGKLSGMRRSMQKKKEMSDFERGSLERQLVYRVKSAFYDLYRIDRTIEINRASQMIITAIGDAARVRYESGTGMLPDLLRAQTELATLAMKLTELERKRFSMAAMLNALRAMPIDSVIDTIPEITPPVAAPLSFDSLYIAALDNSPVLLAMRAEIGMKKAELASAKLEWYPDFMVRTTYSDKRPLPVNDPMSLEFGTTSQRNSDRWSIMLGMSIPEVPWLWKKVRAQQRQTEAAIEGATEKLADMENMTRAETHTAFTDLKSNADRLRIIISSVLPQAQLAFESALVSYKTSGEDFTMLLDTQRMLLMAREEYQMIVMEYLTSIALLEYVSGVTIPFIPAEAP